MSHSAVLTFQAGHPATDGHFPGDPIIPGAVLLQAIARRLEQATPGLRCAEIVSAKFHTPIRPGDTIALEWSEHEQTRRFTARLGTAPAVSGSLRLA